MSISDLHTISDDKLVNRLHDLVRHEREMLLDVLHHLNEVERREIHLKSGYRSMFAYCTGHLKYSESAAGRRIQAARVIFRYPRVSELISSGDINLSTIAKVAKIALSRKDPTLFERVRGKTQDEADAIAAEYRPRARPRDRVRPVSVCVTTRPAPRAVHLPLAAAASTTVQQPATEEGLADNNGQQANIHAAAAVVIEQNYMVTFVAGPELMRVIEQVRSLLSFRLPADASMESVLAIVFDEFIERYSPDRRRERRKGRGKRKRSPESDRSARLRGRNPESVPPDRPLGRNSVPAPAPGSRRRESGTTPRPRHIPAAVRDEVLARDGARCSYIGRNGTRCTATRHLQIDHIVPVARGGGSDAGNLRVLCGAHNRLEAKRLLGTATMAPFTRRE